MKSYEDKINTSLHHDGTLKESSHCIYLSVIVIDSIFKISNNCFQKESKYIIKEKKMSKYISDDIEIFSGDSGEKISDL